MSMNYDEYLRRQQIKAMNALNQLQAQQNLGLGFNQRLNSAGMNQLQNMFSQPAAPAINRKVLLLCD